MTSGKSASTQRSEDGSGSRYGRVSSPAARLSTVSTPSRSMARRISSSNTAVRTIIGQAIAPPRRLDATELLPRRSTTITSNVRAITAARTRLGGELTYQIAIPAYATTNDGDSEA